MQFRQFPSWVSKTTTVANGKRTTKALPKSEQASLRLRFIMCMLCLRVTPKVSFREFHAITGICTHTSIWQYVKKGSFPLGLATKFQDYFGADVVSVEMLMNPMSIAAE